MGDHGELLDITESVFKNLASVSQESRFWQEGPFVDGTRANQNLGYLEHLIWVHVLSGLFPEDSRDFWSDKGRATEKLLWRRILWWLNLRP